MPSSDANVLALPNDVGPILSAYARQTRPPQILLLIYSVFGAICFPLLLALFHFSTARTRRTPLFILVVIDVILGITAASWIVSILLPVLLDPLAVPSRSVFIAIPFVGESITWVVDLVLLLRLYSIFPLWTTPRRTFFGALLLSVLLRAGRVGFALADLTEWARNVPDSPFIDVYSSNNNLRLVHSPLLKLAIFCDILDHAFVTSCFLWKLRPRAMLRKGSAKHSLANRIKIVLYIALGNFVFPTLINVVTLIVISIDRLDSMNALYLIPVTVYVIIFGVVFATVWSSSYEHAASLVAPEVETPRAMLVVALSANNTGEPKQA